MKEFTKLGQNFLINTAIAKKIVSLIPDSIPDILEIGPGRGILSALILERFPEKSFTAVEIDPEMYLELKSRFNDQFRLIQGDIRSLRLKSIFPGKSFFLVGNLPYYISKEIIDHMIFQTEQISGAIFMLQKDFVDKLLGTHGRINAQSVILRSLYEIHLEFSVKPGSFHPAPRVMSTVIRLQQKEKADHRTNERFYSFLKVCFHQPRKTLLNNLTAYSTFKSAKDSLETLSIPIHSRPAEVSPHLYARLFLALRKTSP